MAWRIPPSQTTTVTLASGDDVFIGDNIAITVEGVNASGIRGQFSGHRALIYGLVASASGSTVFFGLNDTSDSGQVVEVKAGGHVHHLGINSAVSVLGYESRVVNAGLISSLSGNGVSMEGTNFSGTVSTLNNSGTIEGGSNGIIHGGTETFVLTNTGTITGTQRSFFGSIAFEHIVNSGRMIGKIELGIGSDSYSGAAGRLSGKLFAGPGNDIVIGGVDSDWFEGGNDSDALTGNAGDDRLIGDDSNDTLNGGIGNDVLNGGTQNDTLFGGAGKDDLTGGANNDYFVFNTALNASTNRDAVRDFSHADDTFRLENAIFTKLGAGVHALNAGFFRAGTAAADANDYIVYNKATGVLSYDANGNTTGGAIAFAILTNKPVLAANDFVVI